MAVLARRTGGGRIPRPRDFETEYLIQLGRVSDTPMSWVSQSFIRIKRVGT